MSLRDDVELENTRRKLRMLEEHYETQKQAADGDAHVRELSLRSVKRLINELKEEITRYESHPTAKA